MPGASRCRAALKHRTALASKARATHQLDMARHAYAALPVTETGVRREAEAVIRARLAEWRDTYHAELEARQALQELAA